MFLESSLLNRDTLLTPAKGLYTSFSWAALRALMVSLNIIDVPTRSKFASVGTLLGVGVGATLLDAGIAMVVVGSIIMSMLFVICPRAPQHTVARYSAANTAVIVLCMGEERNGPLLGACLHIPLTPTTNSRVTENAARDALKISHNAFGVPD